MSGTTENRVHEILQDCSAYKEHSFGLTITWSIEVVALCAIYYIIIIRHKVPARNWANSIIFLLVGSLFILVSFDIIGHYIIKSFWEQIEK